MAAGGRHRRHVRAGLEPDRLPDVHGELLRGVTQNFRERNDGEEVAEEDERRRHADRLRRQPDRAEDQQQAELAALREKVEGMERAGEQRALDDHQDRRRSSEALKGAQEEMER